MTDTNATTPLTLEEARSHLQARFESALAATTGSARARCAVTARAHVAALLAIRAEILRQFDRTLSMYGELERWPDSGAQPKLAVTYERVMRTQDELGHDPTACERPACAACEAFAVLEADFTGALPVQALLDEALGVASGLSFTTPATAVEHFFECIDGLFTSDEAEARVYQAALAAIGGAAR